MLSLSAHPSIEVTDTVYAVVIIGATSCVRQFGQSILSMPVHMTEESESKGKLTIACNSDESPREMTWLSPSSTCTMSGMSMEMISVALQSLASSEVIW